MIGLARANILSCRTRSGIQRYANTGLRVVARNDQARPAKTNAIVLP